MTDLSKFTTKDELFAFLKENKEALIAEKKFDLKRADAIHASIGVFNTGVSKAAQSADKLQVKVVINTTNLFDSHSDVHIDGLWNKTLKEQKTLYLLQEHKMAFDHIITDKVTASIVVMKWRDMGYNMDGQTEALVFDAIIDKKRNPFMFEQYKNGYVLNHSVGMRYVKLFLAIDDKRAEYAAEKEAWDKYYPVIANKDAVNEKGYFWAVTEAKLVEGSAVPMGSNFATPTLEINEPSKALNNNTDSRNSTIGNEIKEIFKQTLFN